MTKKPQSARVKTNLRFIPMQVRGERINRVFTCAFTLPCLPTTSLDWILSSHNTHPYTSTVLYQHHHIKVLSMDCQLFEGAELTSENGKTYIAVSSLGQSNVWTAAEKDNFSNVVVLKAPSDTDDRGSWPQFLHEMVIHELFKESKHIRRQVDRIPPKEDGPPMLVLEIAEMTLWQARTKRPMSRGEIIAIVKGVLQGLEEIHAQSLVYGDLKMENVMISGFDIEHPGDGSNLEVKIGDLGTVIEPVMGTLQPVAYRAPEVYFREEITPAADIWSLGLIYSHLVEAQSKFSEAGIYDDLTPPSSSISQRVRAVKKQISKDYDLRNTEYYKDCALPSRSARPTSGNHWEKRGLDQRDRGFLERVMKADPRERPTARAILASYWFQSGGLEDAPASTSDQSYDGTNDLAVKPPKVTTVLASTSPNISVALPSRTTSISSRKRRSEHVELEPEDLIVSPTKKMFERESLPQQIAPVGGDSSKGGTYLSYR